MKNGRRAIALLLVAFALYSAFVLIRAIAGNGGGSVFWSAVALIAVVTVVAGWGGRRLWRHP